MITQDTVLVLGAGASKEYGLPTGLELKDAVVNAVQADTVRSKDISKATGVPEENFKNMAQGLKGSSLASIDEWLERQPAEIVEAGKICICYVIGEQEKPDLIWHRKWYDTLWQRMTEGTKKLNGILSNRLRIVTFNYDRSLEEFFMKSAKYTYPNVSEQQCAEVLNQLRIVHVYGQAGFLPWQTMKYGDPKRLYYGSGHWKEAAESAKAIKILSEFSSGSPEFELATDHINRANIVLFLGFGYHKENMQRIKPSKLGGKFVAGTYFAKHSIPEKFTKGTLNGFGEDIKITRDVDSGTFLQEVVNFI
ncbi:MAG: hypothetical protein HY401_06760 [Elusimicrobia bacterium]|nr:hypothetical protein [Elusimicrobiota bacterium]